MLKVEGHANLYRDENTGAIINYDSTSYNNYLSSLQKKDNTKKELDKIKSDIDEIKQLLRELLNNKNIL